MESAILMVHSNDAEWSKSVHQFLSSLKNTLTEDFLSQFFFRLLPAKWPAVARDHDLKELVLNSASSSSIDPCSMLLTVIERLPLTPAVSVFRDPFKELMLQIVTGLVLSQARVSSILRHSLDDSAAHPPMDAVIKGIFRVQEVVTNYLGYCPKVVADPVYFGVVYRSFFSLERMSASLTAAMLQNGLLYNKLQYCFSELFKAWDSSLKEKLLTAVKTLSEVNLDSVILKTFEYFHEKRDCSKEIALDILVALCPKNIELLTVKKLIESKYFTMREANLLLEFLHLTTPADRAKALFAVCTESWGNKNFTLIAPFAQQRCKFSE